MKAVPEFLPIYDEVARCNRCGFCQPTCPIYRVTGKEGSVARGHHAHVRAVIEEGLEFSPEMKGSLFECLLCRACVANCFPAVKTHEVMVIARAAYLKRFGQSRLERLVFQQLLPYPSRMIVAVVNRGIVFFSMVIFSIFCANPAPSLVTGRVSPPSVVETVMSLPLTVLTK